MQIFGVKPAHDGSICCVVDGKLAFCLEGEKDSFARHSPMHLGLLLCDSLLYRSVPDVIAFGGWVKDWSDSHWKLGAGYFGLDQQVDLGKRNFFGHPVTIYSTTHERAHIFCGLGLAPYPQGEPCYILVWEGSLGTFYEVTPALSLRRVGTPMTSPGMRYEFLYFLADKDTSRFSSDFPGKVMALAAYGNADQVDSKFYPTIDYIHDKLRFEEVEKKDSFRWSPLYQIGVTTDEFKNVARFVSDKIFDRFESFARQNLRAGYPLIVCGGCGLNCEWNTRWIESRLFSDVFVPPCANDSGAGIGAAIDAQYHYTGNCKVDWSVYSGDEFVWDEEISDKFREVEFSFEAVAQLIMNGAVVAWADGRYEMGPRALGNRSLLAAPFAEHSRELLNFIKHREEYRPVAPMCLEEDAHLLFDSVRPSPHMLYFHKVLDLNLRAVTHVDGSARVQTVSQRDNANAWKLLHAFKKMTGYGVLCNTSLNFKGKGFINRSSDLMRFCNAEKISVMVVNRRLFLLK